MQRIAMWSGPRNISTAMMRSFENRPDTCVVDEPFYGYYLSRTGIDHPGREDIIAGMDCDWRRVAQSLTVETPDPAAEVYYQKHMTKHMLPEMDFSFMDRFTNCFLIREPRRMIASFVKIVPEFDMDELGFSQQIMLFRRVRDRLGEAPPVIDSALTLQNPESVLRQLCERIHIPFRDEMLHWPAGPRASDGVWAPHWYASVEASTGFAEPESHAAPAEVPARYEALCREAEGIYAEMLEHVIRPE
ncbi:MAG: HAD family hydrolase [Chromatocurvus sp.]